MSSANRRTERSPGNLYRTPESAITPILPYLLAPPYPMNIIDPGCGDGAIGAVLKRHFESACAHVRIHGIEQNPKLAETARATGVYESVIVGDWLDRHAVKLPDATGARVVSNPPFPEAVQFVERARLETGPTGDLWILQRLAWLRSKSRRAFHQANPSDPYLLETRPKFLAGRSHHVTRCAWPGHAVDETALQKSLVWDEDREFYQLNPKACRQCADAGRRPLESDPHTWPTEHVKFVRPGTDSADYAWFRFWPGATRQHTHLTT